MKFIGINIGKSSFVADYTIASGHHTQTYPNSVVGIKKFISSLSATEHHCVMEATGNYGFLLLYMLNNNSIAASLVNPKQIKHFARMMMAVIKTDTHDACMIALYGEKMNPPIYKMPSDTIILLKQKRTVIRQLKKQLVAVKNLQGALAVLPHRDHSTMQTLNKTITFLTRQVESLESELADIAVKEFDKQIRLLRHKGDRNTLATSLIIATAIYLLQ